MDSDSESKLIILISQLVSLDGTRNLDVSTIISHIFQIINFVRTINLEPQPKPESKLMSLITQTVSLLNSTDLETQPKPLANLISLISKNLSLTNSLESDFASLVDETLDLEPEPELISLIYQTISFVISTASKFKKLVPLCPQAEVGMVQGMFYVNGEVPLKTDVNKWECLPVFWRKLSLTGEAATYFICEGCNGKNHEESEKAPVEIKHPLHPKHPLRLVLMEKRSRTRRCYCCDEDLIKVIYFCSTCDFAMNVACALRQPLLTIYHPKWHDHTLAHFPRQASLTCDVCALADSTSPFYMCCTCDFFVHLKCTSLPPVIKISRHLHRIRFTFSFDQGDWHCGICRVKIDNGLGGYSCFTDGCSYVAHTKCATQSNVWDGIELEGEPEETEEEEVEPFVRISGGIIRHFSHVKHHLKLDESTGRDYDDCKQCQACITPLYFGNFYSCMQCEYILHETCANLSRKIHHPIHPHVLTLAEVNDTVVNDESRCAACPYYCTAGFFYMCKRGCCFKLHVQCATISEPLVHGSHVHPLFLTSKPDERRRCSVCQKLVHTSTNETFNCIETRCDFALCFECATIPQEVRYKHDKHVLTLSYGKKKTSTVMPYWTEDQTSPVVSWCEACEGEIEPKERFYICDEDCCVTLHIKCLIGKDLYMKPGSSWLYHGIHVDVLPNNHRMSRPICSECEKRCPHKIVLQCVGSVFCSLICLLHLF